MIINWLEYNIHINKAGHYRWPKGMTTNPSWSRWVFDHQLRLCIGGKGWIHLRGTKVPLKHGGCQWLRSGWEYIIEGNPKHPLEFLAIRFDLNDSSGKRRSNSGGLPPENLLGLETAYVETEMWRIVEDITPNEAAGGPITQTSGTSFCGIRRLRATARLSALLMEVDERTLDRRVPPPSVHPRILKLQEIAHQLSEHPGRAPGVEELARQAEYTRAHFCRAFKQVTGSSPQNFVIFWRIHHARQLLLETSLSVKAIAAELGYRNSEFFSRQFHERTGLTPGAYREKNPPLI